MVPQAVAVLAQIVVFVVVVVVSEDVVRVTVPGLGSLRGSLNVSLWTKRTIYQFEGIPYARPPSGELRFREPVAAGPWDGELDATKFKRRCPQALFEEDMNEINRTQNVEDLEDCLYLNVFATQKPTQCSKRFPVMFWIHGGSFRVGSAHGFRPNHLLEQDVVLVTIQYRLGPFGFLSLQDDNISGNMGLLDMLMALQWTKEHIYDFCGDPMQITIFGQSSGGSAVSLMLASPLTKGLFQRAIIQSGGSLCDWTMDHKAADHAQEIAQVVKCNGTNQQIYECLKKVTVYDILLAHSTFTVIDKIEVGGPLKTETYPTFDLNTGKISEKPIQVTLKNSVDSNAIAKYHQVTVNGGNHAVVQVAGKQKFLEEDPKVIFSEGRYHRVPTMVGFTKHEGTLILGSLHDLLSHLLVKKLDIPRDAYENGRITLSDLHNLMLYVRELVVQKLVIPKDAFEKGPMTLSDIYDFILMRNLTEGSALINNGYTEAALKFSGIKDPSGAIADVFNEHYFDRSHVGNFSLMVPGLVDICGLLLLKSCIFLQAKKTYMHTDTYVYTFNYQGHITKWGYNQGLTYPFPGGVAHSDDLVYLFPDDKGNLTEREKVMAKTMVELWTNFAISGKPTPATGVKEWPKMSNPHGPYLRIKTHPEVRENVLDEYNITIKEGLYDYPPPDLGESAAQSDGSSTIRVTVSLMPLIILISVLR